MGFFDGFKTEIEKGIEQGMTNVGSYFSEEVLSAPKLVKNRIGPGQDLNPVQLQKGEMPKEVIPAAGNQAINNSIQTTGTGKKSFKLDFKMVALGLAGLLVVAYFVKKRK